MQYDALLKGKRALVTGGAQGIGKAIAMTYARHGARVAILDVVEDQGLATEKELKKLHADCFFILTDTGDAKAMESAACVVDRRFGGVDILDNNVGININQAAQEITDEAYERVQSVNLRSAYFLCRRYMPGMAECGSGAVLFTSTIHSVATIKRFASYAASKGAINALARALAAEYGPKGVRVNVVSPGDILSSNFDKLSRDFDELQMQDARWETGDPVVITGVSQDIADAHLFFASDMSRSITGQSFLVDGGASAQLHGTDAYPYPDWFPPSKRLPYLQPEQLWWNEKAKASPPPDAPWETEGKRLRYTHDASRHIAVCLDQTGLFHCEVITPDPAAQSDAWVRVHIRQGICAQALRDALRDGEPGLLLGLEQDALAIHPLHLTPREVDLAVYHIKRHAMALSKALG